MGRKTNNEPVDKELAKRLQQLRNSVLTDTSFIRERCYLMNFENCKFRMDYLINCESCVVFDAKSLSQQTLSKILAGKDETTSSYVNQIEKGEKPLTALYKQRYKEFFGEELYNKYVLSDACNSSNVFIKDGVSQPPCFLHRTSEIQTLFDKVNANTVTIVCGDGGVGKTTLVKKFLYKYASDFKYYQTITVKDEDSNSFNLLKFLNALELSSNGKKEFSSCVKPFEEEFDINKKSQWIKEKLHNLDKALFVLDNYTCVGNEISKLEEEFPNCKFIITTRRTQLINENNILNLQSFNDEEACKLFEFYLGRKEKPLSDSEKEIFFIQINSWCLGNAEAIYYVAKMLNYSISSVEEFSKVERWTTYYSNLEKDLTGNSTLADKLALLIKIDKEFFDNLKDRNNKPSKLLAILSITESFELPINSVITFLEEDVQFKKTIIDLEEKGLIKVDRYNQTLKMHPLICHALLLNGIDEQYDNEIALFAYLITNQECIAVKFGLTKLSKIITPKGITKIGFAAFSALSYDSNKENFNPESEKFSNLISVVISDGITDIGDYAFGQCKKLKNISLPNTLKKLGEGVFWGCESLYDVQIPKGIKDIPIAMFGLCKSLETIKLPKGIQTIGEAAFWCCYNLVIADIPEGVTEIGNNAFFRCKNLVVVKTPNSLQRIGERAFSYCREITKMTISNVRHIDKFAFSNCESLREITISNSLKSIGEKAFGCDLKVVYYLGDKESWLKYDLGVGFHSLTEVLIKG